MTNGGGHHDEKKTAPVKKAEKPKPVKVDTANAGTSNKK